MTYGDFYSPSLPSIGKLKKQRQDIQHRLEELRNLREQIRALAREIQSVTRLIYCILILVHQTHSVEPDSISIYDACRRMAARRVDALLLTDSNALLSGILMDKVFLSS
ncbi:hypothetical protein KY290_020696 [Solanum tuberosum]|uniref:PIN domain-containing protein n=1 Tax=Solanum tuberosum TaxID=4113 RepID=A0ABQ7UZD7_SOLTU|nr:hypothetical protein KY290_020696 [Solanum tuberosum]